MESGQHLYQSVSSEPLAAELSVTDTANRPVASSHLALAKLEELVQTRPLLFWGGIWASILCVAIVALSGLLSPSLSDGHRASGAAVGSNTAPAASVNKNGRLPLWLFGAIALSCTAGSILVSKQVARPAPARRFAKPIAKPKSQSGSRRPPSQLKQLQPSLPKSRRPPAQLKRLQPSQVAPSAVHVPPSYPQQLYPLGNVPGQLQAARPQAVSPPRRAFKAKSRLAPTPLSQTPSASRPRPLMPQPPRNTAQKPRSFAKAGKANQSKTKMAKAARVAVTVVPNGENHPLDWGNASLAETLDLRKQRSVSSWM